MPNISILHVDVKGGPAMDIDGRAIRREKASFIGGQLWALGLWHTPMLVGGQDRGGASSVQWPLGGKAFHMAVDVEACAPGDSIIGWGLGVLFL